MKILLFILLFIFMQKGYCDEELINKVHTVKYISEGNYNMGKKNGTWRYGYEYTFQLIPKRKSDLYKPSELMKGYWPICEGQYLNGEKIGKWTFYKKPDSCFSKFPRILYTITYYENGNFLYEDVTGSARQKKEFNSDSTLLKDFGTNYFATYDFRSSPHITGEISFGQDSSYVYGELFKNYYPMGYFIVKGEKKNGILILELKTKDGLLLDSFDVKRLQLHVDLLGYGEYDRKINNRQSISQPHK